VSIFAAEFNPPDAVRSSERTLAIKTSKNKEWWKDQEQVGFVFERALRPLQEVRRDTKQRDIVGVLRQLDIGIIEKGQKAVSAFVEIQKRAAKVGMKDFGDWIYKMQTLAAKELVALSEAGFTQSVFKHVRQLHPNSVKLARIYQIAGGKIEKPKTEFMGFLGAIENKWGFIAVFYQTDKDEISAMPLGNVEEKILDQTEARPRVLLMDIIRHHEKDVAWQDSQFHTLTINVDRKLSWQGSTLRRLMICVEYRRQVTNATNRFFAYDEEYPMKGRRGLCVVSDFKLADKPVTAEVVAIPTEDDVQLSGQITIHDD
jgi:hypothetical protein